VITAAATTTTTLIAGILLSYILASMIIGNNIDSGGFWKIFFIVAGIVQMFWTLPIVKQ
jgi:hypothetical protein